MDRRQTTHTHKRESQRWLEKCSWTENGGRVFWRDGHLEQGARRYFWRPPYHWCHSRCSTAMLLNGTFTWSPCRHVSTVCLSLSVACSPDASRCGFLYSWHGFKRRSQSLLLKTQWNNGISKSEWCHGSGLHQPLLPECNSCVCINNLSPENHLPG